MNKKFLLILIIIVLSFFIENAFSQNYKDKSFSYTVKIGVYDTGNNFLGDKFLDFEIDIGRESKNTCFFGSLNYLRTSHLSFEDYYIINKDDKNVNLFSLSANIGGGDFGKIHSYYKNTTNLFGYYITLGIGLIYYKVPNVTRVHINTEVVSEISSYNSVAVCTTGNVNIRINLSKKIAFKIGFGGLVSLVKDKYGYVPGYLSLNTGITYTPDY